MYSLVYTLFSSLHIGFLSFVREMSSLLHFNERLAYYHSLGVDFISLCTLYCYRVIWKCLVEKLLYVLVSCHSLGETLADVQ